MLARKAFFSFTELTDRARHGDYNMWHQLDHRPENLALPGVAYGERWVLPPDCLQAGPVVADPVLALTHYVNMYWFREPVEESAREWQALAERSFQWGRRPEVGWARRLLMGFFSPVKGYVSSRALVSEDALPFRPNRGIFLTVSQLSEPHSEETEALFRWYDQERIPAVLQCRGVAGAYTFSSESTTIDAGFRNLPGSVTFQPSPGGQGQVRIHLYFLDEDPLEVLDELSTHGLTSTPSALEKPLLVAPLRAITPWQWDWFR